MQQSQERYAFARPVAEWQAEHTFDFETIFRFPLHGTGIDLRIIPNLRIDIGQPGIASAQVTEKNIAGRRGSTPDPDSALAVAADAESPRAGNGIGQPLGIARFRVHGKQIIVRTLPGAEDQLDSVF